MCKLISAILSGMWLVMIINFYCPILFYYAFLLSFLNARIVEKGSSFSGQVPISSHIFSVIVVCVIFECSLKY